MAKFPFFRSTAEKEQAKLEKTQAKVEQKTKDAKELKKIRGEQEIVDQANERLKQREFRDKVNKSRSSLIQMEDDFRTKLFMELNTIKNMEMQNRPAAAAKAKKRLKYCYYTLIVIHRSKERLCDIENYDGWRTAMNEMSNTFKIMNQISKGHEPLKKLLFRYRYAKVKAVEKLEGDAVRGYYGKEIDEAISDAKMKEIESVDAIDIMVSDDVLDVMLDGFDESALDKCLERNLGVEMSPEDAYSVVTQEVNAAKKSGGAPVVEGITSEEELKDEQYEEFERQFNFT